MDKTHKFSLEQDFMNFTIDDLVYGYLQHIATYHPEEKILYIPITKLATEKRAISLIIGKTTRTVSRKIDDLIENNLIIKRELNLNGKLTQVYEIPQKTIGIYKIINEDMMWYIVQTRQQWVLKLYLYLLNKYDWKKQQKEETYIFTTNELIAALGYKDSSAGSISKIISTTLESLRREGVINYVEFYEEQYSTHYTQRKRLLFVAHKIEELPQKE